MISSSMPYPPQASWVGSDIEVSHHNGVVQLLHKDNAVELDEDLSHAIRIEER